ncbi:MAG: hypothetical protein ACPL3C_07965 [Pyrobaculum sp.]
MLRDVLLVDPVFRVRHRTEVHYVNIYIFADTSGSMFTESADAGLPRDVDFAVSVAFSILRKFLQRRVKVKGVIGFFSDKEIGFTCGYAGGGCLTLHKYMKLPTKPYVDYLLLDGTTVADLRADEVKLNTSTGGTDPAPLQKHVFKTYGKPQLQFIVTDGHVPQPILTFGVPTYVYITPAGTTDVECDGPCVVEKVARRQ